MNNNLWLKKHVYKNSNFTTMNSPKNNLCVNLSQGACLSFPLDLSIIPVASLLGIIWVVVKHNNHTRLQLVPLVHSPGPRANILSQKRDHAVLWITVMENINLSSSQFINTHRCSSQVNTFISYPHMMVFQRRWHGVYCKIQNVSVNITKYKMWPWFSAVESKEWGEVCLNAQYNKKI